MAINNELNSIKSSNNDPSYDELSFAYDKLLMNFEKLVVKPSSLKKKNL